MNAFDVLGDPVRRRILQLLAKDELSAGAISTAIGKEFGISQPAVSQHLRVLRDAGFTVVRTAGPRRLYSLDGGPLQELDAWLAPLRQTWSRRLDALETELARGRRQRRRATEPVGKAESVGKGEPVAEPEPTTKENAS